MEWIEGASDFIKVDVERCDGCGNCIRVCLAKRYKMTGKKAHVDNIERCMECNAC